MLEPEPQQQLIDALAAAHSPSLQSSLSAASDALPTGPDDVSAGPVFNTRTLARCREAGYENLIITVLDQDGTRWYTKESLADADTDNPSLWTTDLDQLKNEIDEDEESEQESEEEADEESEEQSAEESEEQIHLGRLAVGLSEYHADWKPRLLNAIGGRKRAVVLTGDKNPDFGVSKDGMIRITAAGRGRNGKEAGKSGKDTGLTWDDFNAGKHFRQNPATRKWEIHES